MCNLTEDSPHVPWYGCVYKKEWTCNLPPVLIAGQKPRLGQDVRSSAWCSQLSEVEISPPTLFAFQHGGTMQGLADSELAEQCDRDPFHSM